MKRQRGNNAAATTTKVTKKKTKGVTVKPKSVAEVKEKQPKESVVAAEKKVESEVQVEEMPGSSTSWCPFWDMKEMGDAYDAFCGDVLWDYNCDVWDLMMACETAPNP